VINNCIQSKSLMRRIVVVAIFLIFTISCKTTHTIQGDNQPKNPIPKLKEEKTSVLVSKIKANKLDFKWLSAHFSIDMSTDSIGQSFSGDIRIRKDSIIWMSVRAILGTIEAIRSMVTQDSAMYMDRLNDTYFKGDYNYINSKLNTADDLDLDLLQSMMIGNCMEFYSDTAKMKSYYDGKQYIISTIRKRNLRRVLYRNRPYHSKEDEQFIFLDPQDFHITHVRLEDFVNHRTFDAYYSDFQKVDSLMFPFHIQYQIVAQKNIKIDLQYKKVSFKQEESVPFIIPKKYQRVQY
jgi:hypothetical protein